MKDILLFDLDGTLTDSQEGITRCVEYALNDQGIEVADRSTLLPFIGPPLIDSFQRFTSLDEPHAQQAVRKYRERYAEIGLFENRVYPGILELLQAMNAAGKHCLMATCKPESYSIRIADRFGLSPYLEHICGATLDGKILTKEAVVRRALERAGSPDLSRVHMIGDRSNDVLGSRACGVDCTYVLYGFGSREEAVACQSAYIVDTVEELKQHLLAL
jgi:phosphoglycolate phosphatase